MCRIAVGIQVDKYYRIKLEKVISSCKKIINYMIHVYHGSIPRLVDTITGDVNLFLLLPREFY